MKNTEKRTDIKTEENMKNQKKNNITEMVFILDKSGSMAGLESDTVGGFNSMIERQKKEDGKAFVTTVLFADSGKTLHDRVDLEAVGEMTDKDYFVGGCTALYDALGDTIDHIDTIHKYIRKEDVPENVMFIITTDGMENASRHYNSEMLKKKIESHKELGWEFLFIGANIDAVLTASSIGISRDRAVNYTCDEKGTQTVFEAMSVPLCSMRRGEKIDESWSNSIREDHENRKK